MLVDLDNPDAASIQLSSDVVNRGGVLLYPADTIYGLGCDPWNESAVKRIFELKGRPKSQGMLVLIDSLEKIQELCFEELPDLADGLQKEFWPGPLTLILRASAKVTKELTGEGRLIGVRWPEGKFLGALLQAVNGFLVSTSANISGHSPPETVGGLRVLFEGKIDLFVEGRDFSPGQPSTVVDLSGIRPRILREGSRIKEIKEFIDLGPSR